MPQVMIMYRIDFFYDQHDVNSTLWECVYGGRTRHNCKNNSMDGAGDSQGNMISSGSINMGDEDTEDWKGTAKR